MSDDGQSGRDAGEDAAPRLVVVTTNAAIAPMIRDQFGAAGFAVTDAGTSDDDCATIAAAAFDLIVIDSGAPAGQGLATIHRLRDAEVMTPILMIADRRDDEVAALNAGADAFVARPIDMAELVSRARTLVRRCRPTPKAAAVTGLGDLRIDPVIGAAHVKGHRLELSSKQFDLLAILARRPGQVMTRTALREQLYSGGDLPVISVIDVFVHGIRQQLAAMHSVSAVICVRGVGFCLVTGAALPSG